MNWSPKETELLALKQLFHNATKGDFESQQSTLKQLEQFSAVPEYNNYLCFIFNSDESQELRSIAGLTLKNNLPTKWKTLPPAIIEYCKYSVLKGLMDSNSMVNNVAGLIITAVVGGGAIDRWPEVLPQLIELLKNPSSISAAFGALKKICEDSADKLDSQDPAFVQKMIQEMLLHLNDQDPSIRASVLECVNQFLLIRSNTVWGNLDAFLELLYKLTNDPSPKVQSFVCQAFNHIVELSPEVLVPVLDAVVQFMLVQTQSKDEQLALEAADFWLVICEQDSMHVHLQKHLPNILPVLLKCMIYTEHDAAVLNANAGEDAHVADREQDIKPRFHKGKTHELENDQKAEKAAESDESDFDDDEEDDDFDEWNVRKSTAAALDTLSTIYGDDLLPDLLPIINQMISHADWKTQEAGILAIGAIANGCNAGMQRHLSGLIPHLITFLTSDKPLVRSISVWSISRYSAWICDTPPESYQLYMMPALEGMLRLCLDKNKEVQKAGCSALATLEEEGREKMIPFLGPIIDTITRAFFLYQKRNMLILYDTFGTLAEGVGSALNQPQYIEKFMPPLLQKYQDCEDDDYDLFSILECLSSVSIAIGLGFAPYCLPVWQRCIRLIKNCLVEAEEYQRNPHTAVSPDKDFMVVALDLMGGIIQGLGKEAEHLLTDNTEPTLFAILKVTMKDETADVRSCSFALLGDICGSCFNVLLPHINDFLTLAVLNLNIGGDSSQTSAMNNACWSAGEVTIRYGNQMAPYVNPLLAKLVPLLLSRETPRSLLENCAITIGRLALVCPELVAPHYNQFVARFLESLLNVIDNHEKQNALSGLTKLIHASPAPIFEHFQIYVNVITTKNDDPNMKKVFYETLQFLKGLIKPEEWDQLLAKLSEFNRARLRTVYGF